MDEGKTPNITIEQLQAIAMVLRRGSPAAAARKLGRSRKFVLAAIDAIESRTGSRLIDRHGTHWRPTEAGRAAAERLGDLLSEFDRFTTAAGTVESPGVGRLVVMTDFEPGLLPLGAWAGRALASQPDLQIALRFGRMGAAGCEVEPDVVVSDAPVADDQWSSEVVGTMGFGLFASPAYLQASARLSTPADLVGHALLNVSSAQHNWTLRDAWDVDAGAFTPTNPPVITTASIADARAAACADAGIALLPLFLAADDVKAGRLTPLLVDWRAAPTAIYCAYRSTYARSAGVVAFVDEVRRGLAEFEANVRRFVHA